MMKLPLTNSMTLTKEQKKRGTWSQIFWLLCIIILSELIPTLLKINCDQSTSFGFINALFSQSITIILILLYCYLVEKRTPKSLGFHKKSYLKNTSIGILLGTAMMLGVFILNILTRSIHVSSNTVHTNWSFIILTFFGFMIQGLSEEVALRGYLMNSFASKQGVFIAILVNSIVFAVLHLANPSVTILSIINLILAGLIFSLLFYLTDNIWLVGASHSLWNFIQAPILGTNVSGLIPPSTVLLTKNIPENNLFNGGSFGFEGGLGVLIISIITIVILLVLIRNKLLKSEVNLKSNVKANNF